MIQSGFINSEPSWKKFMGDFKEPDNITSQDDLCLYEMPASTPKNYDYSDNFSIMASKNQLGSPTLENLGSLLCAYCSELAVLRNKPVIGYYAHSGEWGNGCGEMSREDVQNIESIIRNDVPSEEKLDFILSSPGGSIEASFRLTDMIRHKFRQLSFLLPGSTYSAAVLMTFCGDEIVMQENSHLAPINPQINGFDTFIGKKVYKKYKRISILAPWATRYLSGSKIAENGVTMDTIKALEKLVHKSAVAKLSKYLFKIQELNFFEKIRQRLKIGRIVNYLSDYSRHYSHVVPFYSNQLLSIGLPIKKAEEEIDTLLRKIRYVCEEITTSPWNNGAGDCYIRKVYFSDKHWYVLHFTPKA